MNMEIKKRIMDVFQEVDNATNDPVAAATAVATITSCLGLYLHNNFEQDAHSGIIETIADGIARSAKRRAGMHIHITVIESNKK